MNDYIIDLLVRKLEDYEDMSIYGCDMAYTLLEQYNIDGSITYNTYKAKKWLKENVEEIGDFLENYKFNFGDEALSQLALDIFNSPEKAMVIICLEKAYEIMASLEFIKENWNNEIVLTKENINIIKSELEKERD